MLKILISLIVLFNIFDCQLTNEQASALFDQHIQKYGKQYENQEEFVKRKEIFTNNYYITMNLKEQNPLAEFDLVKSPFADQTQEEFKIRLGHKKNTQNNIDNIPVKELDLSKVPDKVDWRDKNVVTAVKDQGQCGSCWVFSAVETIESQYLMHADDNSKQVILSEEQVTCCDYGRQDLGCNGGDVPTAYEYIQAAGGIESEKSYPYREGSGFRQCKVTDSQAKDCKFDKSKVAMTIDGYQNVSVKGDENELLNGLIKYGPLAICVDASSWQFYSSGILTKCGNDVDHCVQLVGYDKSGSTPYWMVRNSWTEDWGIDGYIHVAMGKNLCDIAGEGIIPTNVSLANQKFLDMIEYAEI